MIWLPLNYLGVEMSFDIQQHTDQSQSPSPSEKIEGKRPKDLRWLDFRVASELRLSGRFEFVGDIDFASKPFKFRITLILKSLELD